MTMKAPLTDVQRKVALSQIIQTLKTLGPDLQHYAASVAKACVDITDATELNSAMQAIFVESPRNCATVHAFVLGLFPFVRKKIESDTGEEFGFGLAYKQKKHLEECSGLLSTELYNRAMKVSIREYEVRPQLQPKITKSAQTKMDELVKKMNNLKAANPDVQVNGLTATPTIVHTPVTIPEPGITPVSVLRILKAPGEFMSLVPDQIKVAFIRAANIIEPAVKATATNSEPEQQATGS